MTVNDNLQKDKFEVSRLALLDRVRLLRTSGNDEDKMFEHLALDIFKFQAIHNSVYQRFVELLNVDPNKVTSINDIPFLPVEAFGFHDVVTGSFKAQAVFRSSGTSNSVRKSVHNVRSVDLYNEISSRIFSEIVAPVEEYVWYALLPGYLERTDASLVAMVKSFMERTGGGDRFFLDNYSQLVEEVGVSLAQGEKVMIIGVTHALLNWLEGMDAPTSKDSFSQAITIIETGGMKGHGREPIRSEVHNRIRKILPEARIISEYGMTELLSQAYSLDGKYFQPPPWMRVIIRDPADPKSVLDRGRKGRIQIIDLANIDSCAFLSTSDLGRVQNEPNVTSFEVLGRFDHSEVRGCNLLTL